MTRKKYIDNRTLEESRSLFMRRALECGLASLKTEEIDVAGSRGRLTGCPIYAAKSAPHYSASAMDGIAVKAESTFGACETQPVILEPVREYCEVDTGDPVPAEFDAVIMIEEVNFDQDGRASIIMPAVPWQHVRPVGEDVIATQMLLPARHRIGPYEMGALLTAGITALPVIKRLRVGIIPTGTELIEAGTETGSPGEITESNSLMLAALCEEWDTVPERYPIVPDDREMIREAALRAAAENDIVVICSGSSAGREDFTAGIIEETGELILHGIAIKPGKPAILGIIGKVPVLGVPGYPVSTALVAELFLKPLIAAGYGIAPSVPEQMPVRFSRKMASHMGVHEFIHVMIGRLGQEYVAYPLNRGAGITSSLVKSDGIVIVPQGVEGLAAGSAATAHLMRPRTEIDNTILAIGSHDLALDYLGNVLWSSMGLRLASTNTGSMGGIMALNRSETHIAGIHLLDPATGEYNLSYLKKYLKGKRVMLINLVVRQQGIMVAAGNPMGIGGLTDLANPKVRYINRQKGAGTRVLFDYLLAQAGIDAAAINGYQREEYSHLAVAAAVAAGTADACMGIYAGARALDLDFIPIASEQYDLCILPEMLGDERLILLRQAMSDAEFIREVEAYGGYDVSISGTVKWEGTL